MARARPSREHGKLIVACRPGTGCEAFRPGSVYVWVYTFAIHPNALALPVYGVYGVHGTAR
jgi:hypothetical protein